MEKENQVKFAIEDIALDTTKYEDDEFAIAKLGFLSTRPNSHGLDISEEVLRESASTILGKWVVVDIDPYTQDATTHTVREHIVGIVPNDQEVVFETDSDGYLRAYVYGVISKLYAKDFYELFKNDNRRSVSVEMKVDTAEGRDMNDIVNHFHITAVTVLGKKVNPSCPQSDVSLVRFSDCFTAFKEAQNKPKYEVDKSKEALSDDAWGDIDKTELRDKIMEAENRESLVKAVYLVVEDGWEDTPSEHLKYPVMQFKDGKLVYNRNALSSALAYAKQNDEQSVVDAVNDIYTKLEIEDSDGKEEKTNMQEIEFAAVDIGNLWDSLWNALHERYPDGEWGNLYRIDGIYEEDGKKFAIIYRKDETDKYRLDLTLTTEGLTLAEDIVKVEVEIVETDEIRKFAEPENAEKYTKFEEKPDEGEDKGDGDSKNEPDEGGDAKLSEADKDAKIAELTALCEEKDNLIMSQTAELEELRKFKSAKDDEEKTKKVEALLSSLSKFMDKDTADKFRAESQTVAFADLDSWSNTVKASVVDNVMAGNGQKTEGFTRMAGVNNDPAKNAPKTLWERAEAYGNGEY